MARAGGIDAEVTTQNRSVFAPHTDAT